MSGQHSWRFAIRANGTRCSRPGIARPGRAHPVGGNPELRPEKPVFHDLPFWLGILGSQVAPQYGAVSQRCQVRSCCPPPVWPPVPCTVATAPSGFPYLPRATQPLICCGLRIAPIPHKPLFLTFLVRNRGRGAEYILDGRCIASAYLAIRGSSVLTWHGSLSENSR